MCMVADLRILGIATEPHRCTHSPFDDVRSLPCDRQEASVLPRSLTSFCTSTIRSHCRLLAESRTAPTHRSGKHSRQRRVEKQIRSRNALLCCGVSMLARVRLHAAGLLQCAPTYPFGRWNLTPLNTMSCGVRSQIDSAPARATAHEREVSEPASATDGR